MPNSRIVAVGSYLPTEVYDNHYLETIVDTSDEWIRTRTGIGERHIAADGELTTDLAVKACEDAFGKTAVDIDPFSLENHLPMGILDDMGILNEHNGAEVLSTDNGSLSLTNSADVINGGSGDSAITHNLNSPNTDILLNNSNPNPSPTSSLIPNFSSEILDRKTVKRFNPNSLDAIIFATTTPDRTFPSCAAILQEKLGISNGCLAFDLQAVCCGFIYAITMADSLIKTNMARNVLVVGAETISRIIDWKDRNTCVLFGDGAGAVILQAGEDEERGILANVLHSDGRFTDILQTSGGVSMNQSTGFIEMRGREVFKLAVDRMSQCVLESLEKCNLTNEDIDVFIPHQANQRIIDMVSKKLAIPEERVVSTIEHHGNTSSASIPLALDFALNEAKIIKNNDIVVLEGLGAGLTWGSVVLRW